MRHDREKIKSRYIIAVFALLALCVRLWNASDVSQEDIAEKILRFHILANSDSSEDQAVKRKVRDAVGAYMAPYLKDAKGLSQTREIVDAHLYDIVQTAESVLAANGFDYGATAQRARVDFPVKTYGDYTFPAGEYEALEITLGEGGGHNWWCVLYPNMCFQGTVYEVVTEDADAALREVLTPEEYAGVFNSGNIEVRFRFLDFFRGK